MKIDITATMDNIEIGATGAAEIIQNIKTIMSTIKGTVPLDRSFGVDWGFIDMPTPAAQAAFTAEIVTEIEKQEPRVKVIRVLWVADSMDAMDGKLLPTVQIKIREGVLL